MFPIRVCASPPVFIGHFCSYDRGNFTSNSTYKTNLDHVLTTIATAKDTGNGFYSFSYGKNLDKANAIGLCRGDLMFDVCQSCLIDSIYLLKNLCPQQKEAIGWFDNCMLRYSSSSIFGVVDTRPKIYTWSTVNITEEAMFSQKLKLLLDSLKNNTSSGGSLMKYATGDVVAERLWTIYGLMQCTPDLSQLQCDECLESALQAIPPCCSEGMKVFLPSCHARYEPYIFFEFSSKWKRPLQPHPTSTMSTGASKDALFSGKKFKIRSVIVIVLPLVAVLALLTTGIFIFWRSRKLRERRESKIILFFDGDINSVDFLQYDFKTIRGATNDFSTANELGRGGFGIVYKGKLLNGQEVAVKRLARGSQQGDLEFKNEVLLVAKLQHRNLVRLLGFCFERSERLLIYEFLPNSSLDRFIFAIFLSNENVDPMQRQYLDWPRRYKIIVGISRGLMYLHEDSRFKVIHHDLKASNILLDAELNPKINDFGMARLCSNNQSNGDTSKIKGTYGYMAPEYALYGHFSVKSDVFSFGVLLLEIVSGQKNGSFQDGENIKHLLSYTWENWTKGTIANIIDPILSGTCIDGIIRSTHLGLLCVQEDADSRPTMAFVVLMLNSNSFTLPAPTRPGFLLHSRSSNIAQQFNCSEGSQFSPSASNSIEEESSNQFNPYSRDLE
ncbi:cysteine-rich receptor-like protein kinase 29 [Cucumis melo var. makuwa]|uniref:Cysteine-rich receptor-like protein kinase 29 n=1 Tax=Cucumis melo var. makuwa TaxID=1194695 RepID=A0A5A7UGV1_CUCMM|nr:cysteine-rich receptor-like protein kinase 29 [Cucumis melo var. makuwa]